MAAGTDVRSAIEEVREIRAIVAALADQIKGINKAFDAPTQQKKTSHLRVVKGGDS